MARMGMVIDLQRCTSCGACAFGCKTENNTANSTATTTYNWADFMTFTEGEFPNTKFKSIPVLCNHCTNAPCVSVCPVTPKAMYKSPNGITLHNDDRCIGCRLCMDACPYSSRDVSNDGSLYSVISFNPPGQPTHPFYTQTTAVIPGGTATPAEVAERAGQIPPNRNEFTHADYRAVRPAGVTEKCMLCAHRLDAGNSPYCVNCCPAGARIVGDFDDPNSEVSQLINQYSYFRLKNNKGDILQPGEAGTSPNVYYIRSFDPPLTAVEEEFDADPLADFISVFPNPAIDVANLKVKVENADYVSCFIYSIQGKLISAPKMREFLGSGEHMIELDINRLVPGTYIVQVTLGQRMNAAKLVVQ